MTKPARNPLITALCCIFFLPIFLLSPIINKLKARSIAKALAKKAKAKCQYRDDILKVSLPDIKLTPEKQQVILNAPATKLVDMLNNDEVTSRELVIVFSERARTIGRKFNLIADVNFEEALEMARVCDKKRQETPKEKRKDLGPLFGIPFSVKDNFKLKGLDATYGLADLCFKPHTEDSAIIQVLKNNGMIPFVKSNVPQMMMMITSTNNIYGRAENPWNPNRTTGGSSGGEAGLITARCSPLGIGTDVAGSIRIPALFCGVYGVKCTSERLPYKGLVFPNEAGRNGNTLIKSVVGPLGKSVDDLRAMLKILISDETIAVDPRMTPIRWNNEWEEKPMKKLRIGVVDADEFLEVSSAHKRAIREACDALEKKGHEIVSLSGIMPSLGKAQLVYAAIFSAEGKLRTFFKALKGEQIIDDYKQWVTLAFTPNFLRVIIIMILKLVGQKRAASMMEATREKKAYELFEHVKQMEALKDEVAEIYKIHKIDAIISPGLALPALRHGTAHSLYINSCFASFWNLLNFPTGCLPISRVRAEETQYDDSRYKDKFNKLAGECLKEANGLPIGVQITTLPYEDEKCLAIMKEVEDQIKFHEYAV